MKVLIRKPQPLLLILLQRPILMTEAPHTSPTITTMTVMITMTMPTPPASDVSTARFATAGAITIHTTPTCIGMTVILATGA